MYIQALLKENNMNMSQLSKISGVPKTTVNDICSGRSSIESCNALTVLKLSKALHCTMEDLLKIENFKYDKNTGKPKDKSYLEKGIPNYLKESIKEMEESWRKIDKGERDLHWDIYWCNLNSDLNNAEVEQEISSEQAWYLRNKYLRMEKE